MGGKYVKVTEAKIYLVEIGGRHPVLHHFELVDRAPELHIQGGFLPVSDRPGLGVDLVEENVRPFLWAELRHN